METAATSSGNPASNDPNTRTSTTSAPRPPRSTSTRMLRSPATTLDQELEAGELDLRPV